MIKMDRDGSTRVQKREGPGTHMQLHGARLGVLQGVGYAVHHHLVGDPTSQHHHITTW